MRSQEIVETKYVERDQGLLNRVVNHVVRDDLGYFYLFMKDGIQRYDGQSFEPVDASVILDLGENLNAIDQVKLLANGEIFITVPSLQRNFVIRKKSLKLEKVGCTDSILFDRKRIYANYKQSGRYVVNKVDLKDYTKSEEVVCTLPFRPVDIAIDDEHVYVSDTLSTIHHYTSDKAIPLPVKGSLINSNDQLYVWDSTKVYRLTGEHIIPIVKLPHENMWLTNVKGDTKGNTVATYTAQNRYQHKLYVLTPDEELLDYQKIIGNDNVSIDFWTDNARYKYMFVGYNAMRIVNIARPGSEVLHKDYEAKKGQFGRVISGVATGSDGSVLFSRESTGIHKITPSGEVEDLFDEKTFKRSFYNNMKLYYSHYDKKYYSHSYRSDGTFVLFQIDKQNKSYQSVNVPLKVYDVLPEGSNEILISGHVDKTETGQIGRYNFQSKKYIPLKNIPTQARTIKRIDNKYWVGTHDGILVYDTLFNPLAVLNERMVITSGRYLPKVIAITIVPYKDFVICGTHGHGAIIIDRNTLKVHSIIDKSTGLSDNHVPSVIEDNEGRCWIFTFNGVNVFDTSFTLIKKVLDHQGLPHREFNTGAVAKDNDGNIYAGTLNGLSKLNPTLVLDWEETEGIDIASIHVYERDNVSVVDKTSDAIEIYSSVDSIVILMQHPEYYKSPFLEYDISLSGIKKDNYIIAKDRVVLKKVPVGDYTITLSNTGNAFQDSIQLNVKKDWRLFFLISTVLLLIGLILYGIIKYLNKKSEERTAYNKRVSELQLKSLQAQMNPHFIFNALGAIQYFIQTHNAEKADEYLSNFAMLMRRILESSKSKYVTLRNEIQMLNLYIGLEDVRFEGLFDYIMDIDDDIDLDSRIPPMIIQPFVENAINHGLYNLKDRKGKLTLSIRNVTNDRLQIIIEDNGVGRKVAEKLRIKKHKSRGMQIVKDKIDTINSSEALQLNVITEDVLDDDRNVAGTRVTVAIDNS